MRMFTCCICGTAHYGFGNNPWPLRDHGECCDDCNLDVIKARFGRMTESAPGTKGVRR